MTTIDDADSPPTTATAQSLTLTDLVKTYMATGPGELRRGEGHQPGHRTG